MDEVIAERARLVEAAAPIALPYPPSWLDRLTAGIARLPGPALLWYVIPPAVLAPLFLFLLRADGTPLDGYELYQVAFVCTPFYALAVLHLLDRVAGRALDDFRPVLTADPPTAARLRYQLTTLPARPTLIATIGGGVAFSLVVGLLDSSQAAGRALELFRASTLLDLAIVLFTWALVVLFIYHTIHQLRTVNTIYTRYTRINLFTLGPLYTFSRLTALTAIVPIPIFLVDYLTWPRDQPFSIMASTLGIWAGFGLLSVATFVLPLLDIHRLLVQEKAQAQLVLAARLQALLAALHAQMESDAPTADTASATKTLLDGLLAEQGLLARVSTWPWAPETPRALATALLLPVVILILSELVKRLFGF